MPPKKNAGEGGAADKIVKKARVARKTKAQVVEEVEREKMEGGDEVLELVERNIEEELVKAKIAGEEDSDKKPRATRTKRTPLTLEEIAEKARGLVPGVIETIEPKKLGIIYSQEMIVDNAVACKMQLKKDEDDDDDEEDKTCYICMCEPCQWEFYKESVVSHMRGIEADLFATYRDVNERNNKVRFAGYTYFNKLATRCIERKRLPKCVEDGIKNEYPSATYTGYRDR
jgi:hypothetical protein